MHYVKTLGTPIKCFFPEDMLFQVTGNDILSDPGAFHGLIMEFPNDIKASVEIGTILLSF